MGPLGRVPKSGALQELVSTTAQVARKKAGFTDDGIPIIIDNSIGTNPTKLAAALRSRGINARSVGEIFGKDPGDSAIKSLADTLGGRVIASDRGRDLAGGFGKATIKAPQQLKSVDSFLRLLE